MLQADPADTFLQYALAMQYVSDGDEASGASRLEKLLQQDADYVPAYLQLAMLLEKAAEIDRSRQVLNAGISVAERMGDAHAAGEMRGFLEQLA